MKKLTSFLVSMLLVSVLNVKADDAAVVANWQFPVWQWVTMPTPTADSHEKMIAVVDSVPDNFDPITANFTSVWNGIQRAAYPITKNIGLAASNKGAADFAGGFKVLFDENSFHVLVQFIDDDITGNETFEFCMAQDYKIPAIQIGTNGALDRDQYFRYEAFGGLKSQFKLSTGYVNVMNMKFSEAGVGSVNWGGTTELLTANHSMKNHTVAGSGLVQVIFTFGYPVLTGVARPDFDHNIWKTLNEGKGISFDILVGDVDTDDELNTASTPAKTPAKYAWNSSHNDVYALNAYAGFLGFQQAPNSTKKVTAENSIFEKITYNYIQLKQSANIVVFNAVGKQVIELDNSNNIDLSKLSKGIYFVRANNAETIKIVR